MKGGYSPLQVTLLWKRNSSCNPCASPQSGERLDATQEDAALSVIPRWNQLGCHRCVSFCASVLFCFWLGCVKRKSPSETTQSMSSGRRRNPDTERSRCDWPNGCSAPCAFLLLRSYDRGAQLNGLREGAISLSTPTARTQTHAHTHTHKHTRTCSLFNSLNHGLEDSFWRGKTYILKF